MALGARMKGEKRVAMTYIATGATSTGRLLRRPELSPRWQRLPEWSSSENTQFAYSTPTSKQSLLKDLADKSKAFGIPGYVGDGNDVLEVYEITKKCVGRRARGKGPQLIEFKTDGNARPRVHDGRVLLSPGLIDAWKKKDPIARF